MIKEHLIHLVLNLILILISFLSVKIKIDFFKYFIIVFFNR